MTEAEMDRVVRFAERCEHASWWALRADVIGDQDEADDARQAAAIWSQAAFAAAGVPTGDLWR